MKRFALAAVLLTLPAAAFGQEVILTEPAEPQAVKSIPDHDKRKEMGDWARSVMERAATGETSEEAEADEGRGCTPVNDRKPHGVVWGTVGTGGYSEVGMIVTQPVGECGFVTVGVSRSEGGRGYRRRR